MQKHHYGDHTAADDIFLRVVEILKTLPRHHGCYQKRAEQSEFESRSDSIFGKIRFLNRFSRRIERVLNVLEFFFKKLFLYTYRPASKIEHGQE
jgi:hypothetical protein